MYYGQYPCPPCSLQLPSEPLNAALPQLHILFFSAFVSAAQMCIGVQSPTGMRQPTPPQIQSDSPCPNGQWLLSGVSVVLPLPKMETVVGLVLCRSRTAAKSSCMQHTRVSTDRTPPHALAFQSHFCAVP